MNATIPCSQTELANIKRGAAIEAIDFAAEAQEIEASYAAAEELFAQAEMCNLDCVRFLDGLTHI